MITLYYNIEDGELLEKTFENIDEYEKFCNEMDDKYSHRGWDYNHTEIW